MISSFIISVRQKVRSKEVTCLQGEFQLNYIMKVVSRLLENTLHLRYEVQLVKRYRFGLIRDPQIKFSYKITY
jgi:hypothetical protein